MSFTATQTFNKSILIGIFRIKTFMMYLIRYNGMLLCENGIEL